MVTNLDPLATTIDYSTNRDPGAEVLGSTTTSSPAEGSVGTMSDFDAEGTMYYDSGSGQLMTYNILTGQYEPAGGVEPGTGGTGGTGTGGTNSQYDNIFSSGLQSAQNAQPGFQQGIEGYIQNLQNAQGGLNERGIQNQLAGIQGYRGVLDLVSQGLTSGGVLLNNRNASDSSATEAIARAYGRAGNKNLVGNRQQFNTEDRKIGIEQQLLGQQVASGKKADELGKQDFVNKLVFDVQQEIAALQASAGGTDLPGQLQIEQDIANLKNQALQALSVYDQQAQAGYAGIQPTATAANQQTALGLANKTPANPFDFQASIPAVFQGGGDVPGVSQQIAYRRPREE